MHDIVGQILFAVDREVPDIREEDGEIEFFSFSGSSSLGVRRGQGQ
jgi:hypothetical protein